MRRFASALILLAAVSCAPKTTSVTPTPTTPHFPDFVQPTVPPQYAGTRAAASEERAWAFLQSGDLRTADREVTTALKAAPDFYPAETTAGYVELARKDAKGALTRFDRALGHRADYAPALAGKGQALLTLNRDGEALDALQAAVAADRSLADIQRQVDVLKFRSLERDLATARDAARAGKHDEAVRAYRAAMERSPDTAFLYREVAAVERSSGNSDAALADAQKATTLDPSDRAAWLLIAELQDARGDLDASLAAYDKALKLDTDPATEAKRTAVKTRADIAKLPAEYRAIESASQITRGDLAALVGIRLSPLMQVTRPRNVGVITDIQRHWAEQWILAVTRAGVLDTYDNHTFQPRGLVRRVDFAQAVTRLLSKVAVLSPTQARKWQNARGRFSDIGTGHIAYAAASAATAAGVMSLTADGAFQPSRLVTGAEAIAALDTLKALIPAGADSGRR